MPSSPLVSRVRFVSVPPTLRCPGLLGWVSFQTRDGLRADGVVLRRSLRGELVFSWPTKPKGPGGRRFILRPVNDNARRAIEAELLEHLFPLIAEAVG